VNEATQAEHHARMTKSALESEWQCGWRLGGAHLIESPGLWLFGSVLECEVW
jgi:hypothetical protein